MAKKLTKAVAAAKLVIANEALETARQVSKHGRIWAGMPRPEWARSLLKRAHERVAEEDEAATKAKASASARIAKLEATVKALKAQA